MKKTSERLKLLGFFSLLTLALCLITLLLFFASTLPHRYIERYIETQLQNQLGALVQISALSGHLTHSLTLHHIQCFNVTHPDRAPSLIFEADRLTLRYNLLKLIFYQHSRWEAINHLSLDTGHYSLTRDKQGQWRHISYKKAALATTDSPSLPPLQGTLYFNNLTFEYRDEKGWHAQMRTAPFIETVTDLSGSVHFKTSTSPGLLTATGKRMDTGLPVTLSGTIDPKHNEVFLYFKTPQLSLAKWGPYAIPLQGYHNYSGHTDVAGYITNKKYQTANPHALWYDIDFTLHNASLTIPYLKQNLNNLFGTLSIKQGVIVPEMLQLWLEDTPLSTQTTLHNSLIKRTMITAESALTRQATTTALAYPSAIQHAISSPSFFLHFDTVKGSIAGIAATLNGSLSRQSNSLYLTINTTPFESKKLSQLFPELAIFFKLNKLVQTDLSIAGNIHTPLLTGTLQSDQLALFETLPITDVSLSYRLYNDSLQLDLNNARLYDAPLKGTSIISTLSTTPSTTASLWLSDFKLAALQLPAEQCTGSIRVSCNLSGTLSWLSGSIEASGELARLFNQDLSAFHGQLLVSANQTHLSQGLLFLNDAATPVTLAATLAPDSLRFNVQAQAHPINTLFTPIPTAYGLLTGTLTATYPRLSKQLHHRFPIPEKGHLVAHIAPLDAPATRGMRLRATAQDGVLSIPSFSITQEQYSVLLSGRLSTQNMTQLNVLAYDFPLDSIPLFLRLVPPQLSPFRARASFALFVQEKAPKSLTGHMRIALSNISANTTYIESLKAKLTLENDIISLEKAQITNKETALKLQGTYGLNTHTLALSLQPSTLALDTLAPMISPTLTLSGLGTISGNIRYKSNQFSLDGSASIPRLAIKGWVFTDTASSFSLKNDRFFLHSFTTSHQQGTLSVAGQTQTIAPYDYSLTSTLHHFPLLPLVTLLKESPFHPSPQTTLEPTKLTIETPFLKTASVPIFTHHPTSSDHSEIAFIHSLLTDKTEPIASSTAVSITGLLSGSLDIASTQAQKRRLPRLTGTLNASDLSWRHVRADKASLSLTHQDHHTQIATTVLGISSNRHRLESIRGSGTLSADDTLTIEDIYIKTPNSSAVPLLSGSITLLSHPTTNHPVDLMVQLSESTTPILDMLSPRFRIETYSGKLLLSITNTLENPTLTLLKSSPLHTLSMLDTHHQPPQNITLSVPAFETFGSTVSFNTLALKSSDPDLATTLSGAITLPTPIDYSAGYLLSAVTLSAKPTEFYLKSELADGTVSLGNSRLTGSWILPLSSRDTTPIYSQLNLKPLTFSSTMLLKNARLRLPDSSPSATLPLDVNLALHLGENVFFEGALFGNDFFGISADVSFKPTQTPLQLTGPIQAPVVTQSLPIGLGSFTILSKSFAILPLDKHSLYRDSDLLVDNALHFEQQLTNTATRLSLKALCVIENTVQSTSNTTLPYTHVLLNANHSLTALSNIYFDVYESALYTPRSPSDLTFIARYELVSQQENMENDQKSVTELTKILLPEFYPTGDKDMFSSIGETQINTLIRRSILRPFEKKMARTIGLNDVRIRYNVGERVIYGTDSNLGLEVYRNIISDRIVLRLASELKMKNNTYSEQGSDDFTISEVELSFFPIKKKNLSINYMAYKNLDLTQSFLSKLSLRYDYTY